MTSTTDLPAGLEPWGEALAALTPALATALLPMVRALDQLFGRQAATAADEGVPDGYDGLAARGTPERIVMSEWLLADEAPMEFLRRAATGELMHLALARRQPRRVGRVVALVDNGPAQHGAPRLAQLAALVVLHRRARTSGGELAVGLLSEPPGEWVTGEIGQVLQRWRSERAYDDPAGADVAAWDAALEPRDEAWVLTGPEVAATLGRRRRVASVRAGAWAASGTATLRVDLDEDSVELALPGRDLGVRAFRRAGYRPAALPAGAPVSALRFPVFAGQAPRLLMRGTSPNELFTVTVGRGSAGTARIRQHVYRSPVVAAAPLGPRLAALLADDDGVLRVSVVGKRIAWLDYVAVPFGAIGVSADELTEAAETGLAALHLLSRSLLVPLRGTWFRLTGSEAAPTPYVAVASSHRLDQPLRAELTRGTVVVDDRHPCPGFGPDTHVVVGGGHWIATSEDARRWWLHDRRGHYLQPREASITIGHGDEVLALIAVDGVPHLVTRSAAGLVTRLAGPAGDRTLTRWSGSPDPPAVHPSLPWLAVRRAPDVVEVGDFVTGETLRVVRADRW